MKRLTRCIVCVEEIVPGSCRKSSRDKHSERNEERNETIKKKNQLNFFSRYENSFPLRAFFFIFLVYFTLPASAKKGEKRQNERARLERTKAEEKL